jgi:3-phenylpropionate/cinnamic acid dioxygenase small subunit
MSFSSEMVLKESERIMAIEQIPDQAQRLAQLLLAREIEEFLYAEAELLDERHFEAWLDLFADDVRYWMPMRRNVKFGEQEREDTRERHDMNWFDEGKDTLRQRVQQLLTGVHWAEEPLSRVCHMVTNVQIMGATADEVLVKSRFLVYRNRLQDETDFFVGKRQDTLRKVDKAWKIARRKITLDQNVLLAKNLTIFF